MRMAICSFLKNNNNLLANLLCYYDMCFFKDTTNKQIQTSVSTPLPPMQISHKSYTRTTPDTCIQKSLINLVTFVGQQTTQDEDKHVKA